MIGIELKKLALNHQRRRKQVECRHQKLKAKRERIKNLQTNDHAIATHKIESSLFTVHTNAAPNTSTLPLFASLAVGLQCSLCPQPLSARGQFLQKQQHPTKCYANKDETKRRLAPNNKASLRWVIQSIQANENNPGSPPSRELLEVLKDLEHARSQKQVLGVQNRLESMNLPTNESFFVRERLLKVTAITGMLSLSLDLFDGFMKEGNMPSEIAYTALCKSLRQARQIEILEGVLQQLGKNNNLISSVAFNTYLAALCDTVTKQDATRRSNLKMEHVCQLEKAKNLLHPATAKKLIRANPDDTSYATVLHAAASVGNRAMVNEVWSQMKRETITPNRYAYNALMKAICNEGPEFDDEAIHLLDKMRRNPFLQPDQYTIDLVLLPVIRTNGVECACDLIDDFMTNFNSQPNVLGQAFSSFLNTLVKGQAMEAASVIFENYLIPRLDQPADGNARFPNVRHFNIVLSGLRKSLLRQKSHSDKQAIRQQSTSLYNAMVRSNIRPDEYTLTILMGMVNDSTEVLRLFQNAVVDSGVNLTPEVLRATIAAFGDTNDPSSAFWLFDVLREEINDSKTWNAMIGALSSSAAIDSLRPLCIESSKAASELAHDFEVAGEVGSKRILSSHMEGQNCHEAAMTLLDAMNRKLDTSIKAPMPNTQTYCLVAAALQHGDVGSKKALDLFLTASKANIPADGRFVNAVLRCFGSDIGGALEAWKGVMRRSCLDAEQQANSNSQRSTLKNLLAAYQGLLYVCGRALRPDIALRIVYAMNKEGVAVNEMALQCYQAGKRKSLAGSESGTTPAPKVVTFGNQFESLLQVECTKYDTNDKRRVGDKRVRIIL